MWSKWRLTLAVSVAATLVVSVCAHRCAGQDSDQTKRPYFLRLGALDGVGRYTMTKWGVVAVEVVNPTDQLIEVLATSFFEDDPNLQYGRRLWVPAGAKRTSAYPVLPPRLVSKGLPISISLKSLLYDRSDPDNEVLLKKIDRFSRDRQDRTQRIHTESLPLYQSRSMTGIIGDLQETSEEVSPSFEAIVAMRLADNLPRNVRVFSDRELPATVEGLRALEQLVLCSDRLASDAAALTAVRRWVAEGGRLWIMLDKIEPRTANLLLGDVLDYQVVDRVGLTEVRIDGKTNGRKEKEEGDGDNSLQYEQPVDLLRVLVDDVDVTHTVNGWPAAFWKQIGRGQVLLTTLDPRGWIRRRNAQDPRSTDLSMNSAYIALKPLSELSERFFQTNETMTDEAASLESFLSEQIGYEIVGRGPVMAVLSTFCAFLLLAGVWTARAGRLEWMGWIGPIGIAISATVLVVLGLQSKHSVPSTSAVVQLVEVVPGSEHVRMTGLVAVYYPQESKATVGAERGGMFQPDREGLTGMMNRMVFTDIDAWYWENLTLPVGVRVVPFEYATRLKETIEARGTFGPDGFSGTVKKGPFEEPGDAIIVGASQQRLAVDLKAEGFFSAGPDDLLAPDEFLTGALLNDRQRRRQTLYQRLLPTGKNAKHFTRPTLFAWAKSIDMHFNFPGIERKVGTALLSIPLTIDRPAPGTQVAIPAAFLKMRLVFGPADNVGALHLYRHQTGQWDAGSSVTATQLWLRFKLPPQVLPIELERAKLVLKISAPSRQLVVSRLVGEEVVRLGERNSPLGKNEFMFDSPNMLSVNEDGEFIVGLNVGPSAAAGNNWKIDNVSLDVWGRTVEQ